LTESYKKPSIGSSTSSESSECNQSEEKMPFKVFESTSLVKKQSSFNFKSPLKRSPQKTKKLSSKLKKSDIIVLSSSTPKKAKPDYTTANNFTSESKMAIFSMNNH